MGISFAEEKKLPVKEKVNEFREVVEFLAKNAGAIRSYVVSEATEEESWSKVAADKRRMTEAGNDLEPPRTVRTKNELLDDGKSIKVYIHVLPNKIRRGVNTKVSTTKK